jgi:hypothetical protein
MIDWPHALETIAGVIATVVAIKVDIQWLKRWTKDHAKSDEQQFGRIETRLVEIERKL